MVAHIVKQRIDPERRGDTPSRSQTSDLRVLTTAEEIEGARAFWEQHQSFIYADIDFYLYELANCPNVLQPYVLLLSKNNRPTCLLVARIMEPCLDWRLGYLQVSPRRARCLEVLPNGLLGELTEADLLVIFEQLVEPLRTGQADFTLVKGMEAETPLAQAICSVAPREGYDTATDEVPHWMLQLAGTFEDFVRSRRKKMRNTIRNLRNRIDAQPHNVSVTCYNLPSDVPRAAKEADAIAAKTYQRGIGVGLSDTPALRSAWQHAATKGWLRVYILYLKGEPIAFEQGLAYKNAYLGIFAGYDPTYRYYSPGHYLFLRILQSLYAEGDICTYDFGWGTAQYKKEFGSHCVEESDLYLFAPTLRGRRLKWTKALTSSFNRQGKEIFARLKVLDATKKYWRRKATEANVPKSGKLES